MTTSILPIQTPSLPLRTTHLRRPNLLEAWFASFLIYFFPRLRKNWLAISPLQAVLIALFNFAFFPLWLALLSASYIAHNSGQLRIHNLFTGEYVPHPFQKFVDIFESIPKMFSNHWNEHTPFQTIEHVAIIIGGSLTLLFAFAILFFVLLPFAAKPGPNKPCALHTLRAVFLGTGWIHIWFPVLSATFIFFIADRFPPNLENFLAPLAAVLILLSLWTLAVLISAVRADYRGPGDFPEPHDPWCEECGYNLIASDPLSRCPECGTPIPQSIGPATRPPTPWEKHPSLHNFRIIRRQIVQLFRRPRQLFFAMPTLTGQPAAQRWLLASTFAVALLASLILPIGKILGIFTDMDWSWNLLLGSLFVGLTWGILALMMVGIETAGIATFSRLRAKREAPGGPGGVYLAASAKVTAYSSILMLPWVVLGGAQLLAVQFWQLNQLTQHFHLSPKTEQILLAGSLSLAHIGGLLWYELTVYRGIRAIQYANK